MDRRLPDTPWHMGYVKKAEDDPQRHKARCIHNMNGKCNSGRSNYYKEICGGSSHCGEYSETYEDSVYIKIKRINANLRNRSIT